MRYSRNHCKNNLSWRDITGINKILRKSPLVPHIVCQQQCPNDRQFVNAELRRYWPLSAVLVRRTKASSKICLLKTYNVLFHTSRFNHGQMDVLWLLSLSMESISTVKPEGSLWGIDLDLIGLPVYGSHRGTNLWSLHKTPDKTNIWCVKAVYRWHLPELSLTVQKRSKILLHVPLWKVFIPV